MNKAFLILKRFCIFFSLPYLELVLLRFLISRQAIYEHLVLLFSPGLIFYSLIPLSGFVVFELLLDKKGHSLAVKLQRPILAINILFFILFLLTSLYLDTLEGRLGKIWLSVLWYDLASVTFATAFLVSLDLKDLFLKIKTFWKEALFSFVVGNLFFLFHFSINYLWHFFSKTVLFIVYKFLKFTGFEMIYVGDGITLKHPLFTATIAAACSGLEGIFLFIFLFSVLLVLDWEHYSKKKAAIIYLAGILYMFSLNILRVALFFMAAVWATKLWGKSQASEFFIWTFHANIGWVFYLAGIAIFFSLLLSRTKHPKTS